MRLPRARPRTPTVLPTAHPNNQPSRHVAHLVDVVLQDVLHQRRAARLRGGRLERSGRFRAWVRPCSSVLLLWRAARLVEGGSGANEERGVRACGPRGRARAAARVRAAAWVNLPHPQRTTHSATAGWRFSHHHHQRSGRARRCHRRPSCCSPAVRPHVLGRQPLRAAQAQVHGSARSARQTKVNVDLQQPHPQRPAGAHTSTPTPAASHHLLPRPTPPPPPRVARRRHRRPWSPAAAPNPRVARRRHRRPIGGVGPSLAAVVAKPPAGAAGGCGCVQVAMAVTWRRLGGSEAFHGLEGLKILQV